MIPSVGYGQEAYADPACKGGYFTGSDPATQAVRSLSIVPEMAFVQVEQVVTAGRQEANVA
jgi:hypothetical protein